MLLLRQREAGKTDKRKGVERGEGTGRSRKEWKSQTGKESTRKDRKIQEMTKTRGGQESAGKFRKG
jgi:hypothetical protein